MNFQFLPFLISNFQFSRIFKFLESSILSIFSILNEFLTNLSKIESPLIWYFSILRAFVTPILKMKNDGFLVLLVALSMVIVFRIYAPLTHPFEGNNSPLFNGQMQQVEKNVKRFPTRHNRTCSIPFYALRFIGNA